MGRKKINELAIADKRYPIPLDEARLAMFSGWTKSLVFESEYFGTAEITGENGLTQAHADIMDFCRMYYRQRQVDESGRHSVIITFSDFAKLKGVTSTPVVFRKLLEDFVRTQIKVTRLDGSTKFFVVCDLAEYLVKRNSNLKPIPPKKGSQLRENMDEVKEHNRIAMPKKDDGYFEIRFSKEYVDFMSGSKFNDYSKLLPDIVKLKSDTLKKAARFFLTHTEYNISTEHLHRAIFFEQDLPDDISAEEVAKIKQKAYSAKCSQKKALRAGATILKNLTGVCYDEVKDRWYCTKHPDIFISALSLDEIRKKALNGKKQGS